MMSKRALRISNSAIRAIEKHCREVCFYELENQDPSDEYERLYHEAPVREKEVVNIKAIYTPNPSQETFEDAQLKAQGDATIVAVCYELEKAGVIGSETSDYNRIPSVITGCHVKVDDLRYTILQISLMSFLEGYPIQYSMSLKLDESDNEVVRVEEETGDENTVYP